MQLYWTRKQVLKRLLSSYQVQLTLGSSEALNDLPQQKHKRDNQRVRITQRVGRAIIKLPASINEKKQVRRNPLIQPCVPGLPEVRLGTAATVCYLEWNFRYRKPNGKHTGELKSWAPQWPGIFHAPCWFWTILIRCSDWCPMNELGILNSPEVHLLPALRTHYCSAFNHSILTKGGQAIFN